jgi:hydroxypyruvate reductase
MISDHKPGHVLLVANLMQSAVDGLDAVVQMLDGRDPAVRDELIRTHAGTIRGIATSGHAGASRALIEALPKLELIACFSAGVDNVDVAAAAEHGIPVTATSDALADDVADLAIAHCLMLLRRLGHADRFVRDAQWPAGEFALARSLRGKRLGIVGMGTIGGAIARRADAMAMTVHYTSRSQKPALPNAFHDSAVKLAEACDVLVVCCPATAETFHLIDATVLNALGADGYLINIARGSVVDEAALVTALQAGTIAGAGLDVFEDEPRPLPALLSMDNVILTPHIGSGTHETRAAMGQSMIDSLVKHLSR